jgi:hypothetical protein
MNFIQPPIIRKIVWVLVITGLILVGCGQTESTEQAVSIPPTVMVTSEDNIIPSEIPVNTPTQVILPSHTAESPTQEPSATAVQTVVPTKTVAPAPAGMSLMDWTLWGWTSSTSPMACQDTNSPCWMLTNYKELTSLDCAESIYLNAALSNHSLVFQTRYSIKDSKAFGYVEIQVVGESIWNRVYTLKGSRDYWHEVAIDLSSFNGKEIKLRFATRPYFTIVQGAEATKMVYNKQTSIIQNINIVSK